MKERSERVRSWDVGEVSPARESAWRFSGRRVKSLLFIWMRGMVGLLWTLDWIQAKAIELTTESRSELGPGSAQSERGEEMYAPPASLPITMVHSPPLDGDARMSERYRSFDAKRNCDKDVRASS